MVNEGESDYWRVREREEGTWDLEEDSGMQDEEYITFRGRKVAYIYRRDQDPWELEGCRTPDSALILLQIWKLSDGYARLISTLNGLIAG